MEELYNYCVKVTNELQNDKEKLNKLKEKKKKLNAENWLNKKKIAYNLAFEYIIKNSLFKIKDAVENGYTRTDLLSCKRSDNLQFNGIYISDILKKSHGQSDDIIKRLQKHFHPFNIFFKTIPLQYNNDFKYIISISWT